MQFFKDLRFRAKIWWLIGPALVGLLILEILRISSNADIRSIADEINLLTELSRYNNALVHEMQKERGATAVFVGTQGQKFGDILTKQRQSTDKAMQSRSRFVDEHKNQIENESVNRELGDIASGLLKLKTVRSEVDNLSISRGDAISFYTQTHEKIIGLTRLFSDISHDAHVTKQLLAYYNFLEGKERAGIERAVVSTAFANDSISVQGFGRFLTLLAQQDTYLLEFEDLADEELKTIYHSAMKHSSIDYVKQKREILKEKGVAGQFGIASGDWFAQSTERINQLKKVEDATVTYIYNLTEEQYQEATARLLTTVLLGGLLLLMVIGLAWFIGNFIVAQVDAIASTIANAEKNRDLTLRVDVSCNDELGATAKAINNMFETFQNTIREIETCGDELAASSKQTSLASNENLENLHLQQDETQLVATAVEEMSASVQEVAKNTSQTASLVAEVDRSVDESIEDITRSRDEMENLSQQMSKANDLIVQLRNSSSDINSVVEVIKSVAEQTNLLALNAAIEAARAGEQGRGFAVVADEVRTLAQRVQESTSEIESMVGRFQTDASSVSESIGKCSEEVVIAVEQTRKLEEKLNTIGDAATAITNMSAQVATATEEQVNVANEMAGNITTINDLAERNATSGSQVASASKAQRNMAENMAKLANQFKC